MPHRDDARLFTCGKLVEKRIPILLEKAGEGLDGPLAQRGCNRLGRLLGAERGARPNDGLLALVLRKEGERAREPVGRGERRLPLGREGAGFIGHAGLRALRATMTNEDECAVHGFLLTEWLLEGISRKRL